MKDLVGGVRILDVTTIVMGPYASQVLADLGAEVLKIESLDGDLARHSGSTGPDGTGALFANNNRNKKSVAIDLRRAEGRVVMERLIGGCDVLLHNMRPAAAERLGLSPQAVRAINPGMIHCAAVGFGGDGPYAGRGAYDDVIQAASGLAALPLALGGEPAYVPSIVADKVAALHVVYALLAALLRRERTGEGGTVEVPMFEAMAAFMMNEHLDAATFADDGAPGYRRLLSPNRRPFRTADGWLAVLPYGETHWRRTLEELGRRDLADEPWFATAAGRNAKAGALYGVLVAALPQRPTAAWVEVFTRLDVPHAPMGTIEDLLDDPHLDAVAFFRPRDALPGRVRSVPQPVLFRDVPEEPDRAPPALGADTDDVLRAVGYGTEEIDALRSAGVIAG